MVYVDSFLSVLKKKFEYIYIVRVQMYYTVLKVFKHLVPFDLYSDSEFVVTAMIAHCLLIQAMFCHWYINQSIGTAPNPSSWVPKYNL